MSTELLEESTDSAMSHAALDQVAFPSQTSRYFSLGAKPLAQPVDQGLSVLGVDRATRMAMMVAPKGRGTFDQQVDEVLNVMADFVSRQGELLYVTVQTVFLRDATKAEACRQRFSRHFGSRMPVTNFVFQPPCCGAELAVEAWAVGGPDAEVRHLGPNLVTVSYDGIQWIHCAGVSPKVEKSYDQSAEAFATMAGLLAKVGANFHDVVRTWLYIGGITNVEDGIERYRELNRARTDFFENIKLGDGAPTGATHRENIYPASTGIGTLGTGLTTACLALKSDRKDFRVMALENPLQTPSYCYERKYSIKSPKFSRATALVLPNYVTPWVSGTASIVNSETRHPGDIVGQTEQTIENIEHLISRKNLARKGVHGAGSTLADLAKVRVYVKRPEDYAKCRAVCEHHFGNLPTIYAFADVCRPDLLVEIEGVAFSPIRHHPIEDGGAASDYLVDP